MAITRLADPCKLIPSDSVSTLSQQQVVASTSRTTVESSQSHEQALVSLYIRRENRTMGPLDEW